jgi:hypothetical protein
MLQDLTLIYLILAAFKLRFDNKYQPYEKILNYYPIADRH